MANLEVGGGPPRLNLVARPEYNIARTLPDELLRHDISDEELDMLCGSRTGGIREGMWAAIGTTAGAIPTGLSALVNYFVGPMAGKIAVIDFIQIAIMLMSAGIAVVLIILACVWHGEKKPLEEKIRERTTRVSA